jgi:dTDP-4-amino-4,6-dideoxygalactose transaminase
VTIPIAAVEIGPEEEQLVLEVLRSGRLAQGPMVERLEAAFTALVGTRHAVAVSSGTTALVASLEALGLGPGDEVITSAFTFVATLNAILESGATARLVDIADDFTIDPGAVEAAITPATRAVLPVHLYGMPASMPAIVRAAETRQLGVIEDACQAHGATIEGRSVGSFGVGCFSLYATKSVVTGEGGVITCDDDAVADRLRLLRNQGMRTRYEYELAGHNYRLTEMQAALGLPQLARLPERIERRRVNAAVLSAGLAGVPGLETPTAVSCRGHAWHQYTVRVLPEARLDRHELAAALERQGIATGIYYPRVVFDYECYREHPRVIAADVPNAHKASREVLSLPVHPEVTDRDLGRIIDTVREVLAC